MFVNLIKHAFYVTDNFFIYEFAILFQKYECQKNIYFRFYGFKNPWLIVFDVCTLNINIMRSYSYFILRLLLKIKLNVIHCQIIEIKFDLGIEKINFVLKFQIFFWWFPRNFFFILTYNRLKHYISYAV